MPRVQGANVIINIYVNNTVLGRFFVTSKYYGTNTGQEDDNLKVDITL